VHQANIDDVYNRYCDARLRLIADPSPLLAVEEWATAVMAETIREHAAEIAISYAQASELYPFWRNHPPDERGRAPRGDQYPWIEVGEHAVGGRLVRAFGERLMIQDMGFPSGPDQRLLLLDESVVSLGADVFDAVWLAFDIKTVGPRDDADHAVMSHNQVSGTGQWDHPETGMRNGAVAATGRRRNHAFYPSLPPLVVLNDLTTAATVTMAVKPVYRMLEPVDGVWQGQPLARVDLATIPNGLLLTQNPNYLAAHPGLLFPGKDDAGKNPLKVRARVDFSVLRRIAPWRHQRVWEA
jgi:hypothetical protein